EAAITLLRDAFKVSPTLGIAKGLERLLESRGMGGELAQLFEKGAESVQGAERAALLGAAAARIEGDPDRQFALYRQVVEITPENTAARDFCIAHAEAHEMWEDLIALFALAAKADEPHAHELVLRAAALARDKIKDTAREISLLKRALELQPRDVTASLRL